jgi:hypothetical protein
MYCSLYFLGLATRTSLYWTNFVGIIKNKIKTKPKILGTFMLHVVKCLFGCLMVFNTTINTISVIS